MLYYNYYITLTVGVLLTLTSVSCWNSNEMQLFDLVEELNQNFYNYLGLSQNATTAEIRRAYRKLSLKYHPDKNPGEENSKKFRQIVGIYEILKDDELRERYNDILKYGLPDWKMPVFYYRKLRKMSFVETFSLFFLIATFIHYACLWGVYMEKRLNMDELLRSKLRKKKIQERKNRKIGISDVNNEDEYIPTPTWKDILPFALYRLCYDTVVYTPATVKMACSILKEEVKTAVDKKFEKKRKAKELEEEKQRIEEEKRLRKERKFALSKEQREQRRLYEEAKKNSMLLPQEHFTDIPSESIKQPDEIEFKSGKWTNDDTIMLIRALAKYPSGIKDRWMKISEMLKRPIPMITENVLLIQKKSKAGRIPIDYSSQNTLGTGVITNEDDEYEDENSTENNDTDDEYGQPGLSKAQLKKQRKQQMKLMKSGGKNSSNFVQITQRDWAMDEKEPNGESSQQDEDENKKENDETDQVDNVIKQRKKPRTKQKYVDGEQINNQDDNNWTQKEQKQLEDALRLYPKGTSERWDRISQKIPTKSKIQCIERIKKLSEIIQKKNIDNANQ